MRRNILAFHWPSSLLVRPASRLNLSIRAQSSQARQVSRIDRLTAKLPRRLQKYTNGLRNAPVSHVVSFMILHELTAIIPLFGLFGVFHYTEYVPVSYMSEHFGTYVQEGLGRFERYFKRKGWFGFGQGEAGGPSMSVPNERNGDAPVDAIERWQSEDGKYKILVEVALAYAITKALLPVRIIGSAWATPWFAGVMKRIKQWVGRKAQ